MMKAKILQQYQLLTLYLRLRKTTFSEQIKKDVFSAFKKCNGMIARGMNGETSCKIGPYEMKASDPSILRLLLREIFVNEIYYAKLDNDAPEIIDCGSNLGFSILYFKLKYPKAKIVGIEANDSTFSLLEQNVRQFSDVKVYNRFVSNVSDQANELFTYGSGDVTASFHSARGAGEKHIIQSIALKDLINGKKIDLLKMDIEGGEYAIFNQKEDTSYMKHVDNILIEYHHIMENNQPLNSFSEFMSVFEKNGFVYFIGSQYDAVNPATYQDISLMMKRHRVA